jgi:hypothetical protein
MGYDGGRRDNWGILRQLSQKRVAITWGKEGMGNGKGFTIIMSRCGMRPKKLLLYDKRMVIRLGDGL